MPVPCKGQVPGPLEDGCVSQVERGRQRPLAHRKDVLINKGIGIYGSFRAFVISMYLFMLKMYLLVRKSMRVIERSYICGFTLQMVGIARGWAKPKPKHQNYIQICHVDGKSPKHLDHSPLLSASH